MVRGIDLDGSNTNLDVIVPVVDLSRPTAMDFHAEAGHLYLADSQELKIRRQALSGSGDMSDFITEGLNNVMGLAVDWVGGNLYWTDEGLQAVYVASLSDPSSRRLLLFKNMTHPRSIIVDATSGVLFWSDWPSGPMMSAKWGKIDTAWMDGTNRRTIVEEDTLWPNGLTLDNVPGGRRRLFWCDSYLQKIESIDLETMERRTHISAKTHDISRPYGLAYHNQVRFHSTFRVTEKFHLLSYSWLYR